MKRTLAIVITIFMLAALAIPAFADTQTEIVGYSDSRVEKKDLTAIPAIWDLLANPETTATEFKISNAAELTAVSANPQSFDGVTLYLANDIDMTGVEDFAPIGSGTVTSGEPAVGFRGVFDGQGYEIKNLVINADGLHHVGLFGVIQGATIKNVIFGEGCKVTNGVQKIGGIVGSILGDAGSTSIIDNCWNKADVDGGVFVGGIAGRVFVSESRNEAGQALTATDVATARDSTQHYIKNCTNSGDVKGTTSTKRDIGGIAGAVQTGLIIENCRNTGEVSGDGEKVDRGIGGLIGRVATVNLSDNVKVEINGSINNGNVVNSKATCAALIGNASVSGIKINNCKNFGTVSAPVSGSAVSTDGLWAIKGSAINTNVTVADSTNTPGAADATKDAALAADQTITGAVVTPPGDGDGNGDGDGDGNNDNGNDQTNNNNNTNNNTNENKNDNTSKPTETTAAEVTTAAPAENIGCSSSIAAASVALVALCAGVAVSVKRKED